MWSWKTIYKTKVYKENDYVYFTLAEKKKVINKNLSNSYI